MKTIIEWAEELECPEIKARFIRAIKEQNCEGSKEHDLPNAINHITWRLTKEGKDFWYVVNEFLYEERAGFSFEDLINTVPPEHRERITGLPHGNYSWNDVFAKYKKEKNVSSFAINELMNWLKQKYSGVFVGDTIFTIESKPTVLVESNLPDDEEPITGSFVVTYINTEDPLINDADEPTDETTYENTQIDPNSNF